MPAPLALRARNSSAMPPVASFAMIEYVFALDPTCCVPSATSRDDNAVRCAHAANCAGTARDHARAAHESTAIRAARRLLCARDTLARHVRRRRRQYPDQHLGGL